MIKYFARQSIEIFICFLLVILTSCSSNKLMLHQKYFENGQLEEQYSYYINSQNKPIYHGLFERWHQDGKKEAEWHFKNGQCHGIKLVWWENGNMEYKTPYTDDKKNGKAISWYENGQKQCETNYVSDKRNGLQTSWWDSGQIESETYYVADKEDGVSKSWHKNGQKASEINYKAGLGDGPAKWWDNKGNLIAEGIYQEGKPWNGTFLEMHEWGYRQDDDTMTYTLAESIRSYKNGELDGLSVWFDKEGKIIAEGIYADAKPLNGSFKDKVGKDRGMLWKISEYRDGTTVKEGVYRARILKISGKEWQDYGVVKILEGTFKDNEKWDGNFLYYDKDKGKGVVFEFKDGKVVSEKCPDSRFYNAEFIKQNQ